jgi:hypothetical protein
MSMWSNIVYTAAGQDNAINEMIRKFVYNIVDTFPNRMLSRDKVFIDMQGYIENPQTTIEGTQNPRKIPCPRVFVNVNGGGTDLWSRENQMGTDNKVLDLFPGNYKERRLISPHRNNWLKDPITGILIDISDMRRGVELEMRFEFDTKADLILAKTYMMNTFEIRKWARFNANTLDFIIPPQLIVDVTELAMIKEKVCLHNPKVLDFIECYFNTFGHFKTRLGISQHNPNDREFILERTTRYPYFMEIEDGKDGSNADKEDLASTKFSFTVNVKISSEIPFAYTVNAKTFNIHNKGLIDDIFIDNVRLNEDSKVMVKYNPPVFIDDRQYIVKPLLPNAFLLAYEDFFINPEVPGSGEDYLNICDFLPLYRCNDITLFFGLMMYLTPEERKDLFEVQIYMNTVFLGWQNYKLKDDGANLIVDMKNLDENVTYVFYLYWDLRKVVRLLERKVYPRMLRNHLPNTVTIDGKKKIPVPGTFPIVYKDTIEEVIEYGICDCVGEQTIDVHNMDYPISGRLPKPRAMISQDGNFATMLPRVGDFDYYVPMRIATKYHLYAYVLREKNVEEMRKEIEQITFDFKRGMASFKNINS